MQADRTAMALNRIEIAALRIEAAVRTGPVSGEEESGVQYKTLRREAATALAELDQLIARFEL